MDDPEDLDPLVLDAVERHVLTRDQVPQARCNIIACHARLRVPGKLFPPLRDRIENTIRSPRVVFGDVHPDGDQIFIGPRGAQDRQHGQSLCRAASERRLASAVTSAMVARGLGPLSIPSCTIWRSSLAV
jgi:hypothetical protein